MEVENIKEELETITEEKMNDSIEITFSDLKEMKPEAYIAIGIRHNDDGTCQFLFSGLHNLENLTEMLLHSIVDADQMLTATITALLLRNSGCHGKKSEND